MAVLDVVQRVRVPPAWGAKGVAESVEVTAGGPATNAAITCAGVGVPVTLITALGESPQAELVRHECARFGVTVIDISDVPPSPTKDEEASAAGAAGWLLPVSSCIVDAAGERTVVSTGAAGSELSLGAEGREAITALSHGDVLLLDGHHPVAALESLMHRPSGTVAVLDAGSVKPHAERWLPRLDVVAGSADYAAGLGVTHEEALAHALDSGAGAAVITDGAGPVLWRTADGAEGTVTPPPTTSVDTLGAGDAWHGAFAAALAGAMPMPAAVEFACRVATIRVSHVGARRWLEHAPRVSSWEGLG